MLTAMQKKPEGESRTPEFSLHVIPTEIQIIQNFNLSMIQVTHDSS
jgi:hypothetical protein